MFVTACVGMLFVLGTGATELVVELRRDPQFWVVTLQNVSKHSLRVWEDQNSWGYDSLTFEVRSGVVVSSVPRPKVNWRKNTPGTRELTPGGRMELQIRSADLVVPTKWQEVRALYAPKHDAEAERSQVWKGKSASKWVKLRPGRA